MEKDLKEIIEKCNYIFNSIKIFTDTFGNIDYKEKNHTSFLNFLHKISDDIFHIWDFKYNPSNASLIITINLSKFYPDKYTARISFLKNRVIELNPDDNSKYQFKKISGDHQEIQKLVQKLLIQFRHPELKKGEIYYCDIDHFNKIHNNECKIFNSTDHVSSEYKKILFNSKRMGNDSYNSTGKIYHLWPVFISLHELSDTY